MPTSMLHTWPHVLRCINIAEPSSILDCGIGFGRLGFLLREQSLERYLAAEQKTLPEDIRACWQQRIDGIEGFPPVISSLQRSLYDNLYISKIEDAITSVSTYDVIYMGDVIEHFDHDRGIAVFRHLYSRANKMLIVVTPAYKNWEQGAVHGNQLEIHRSFWDRAMFRRLGRECPHLLQFTVGGQFPPKRVAVVCKDEYLRRQVVSHYGLTFARVARAVYHRLPWLWDGRVYRWYNKRRNT